MQLQTHAHLSPVREGEEEEEMITEPTAADPSRASEQKWESAPFSYFCFAWVFIFIHLFL